ncbi:RICIN domain-containing protein [Actinocorallia sp. B10E7]|uniref:RICIN domain-containing protein n=1 Tax=Actinocorallia sp. B10E7 TaxID=3153558 RepID=UPI00325E69FF
MNAVVRRALRVLLPLAVAAPTVIAVQGPASAGPADVIADCMDPRNVQQGDYIYEDPECVITINDQPKQVWSTPERKTDWHVQCETSGSVSFSKGHSQSTSFSVGLDFGLKHKSGAIGTQYEQQMGAKIGWSWSWTKSYSETHSTTVPAYSVGWIEVQDPLYRSHVTVKASYDGNRNETATDYVTSPDNTRSPVFKGYTRALTASELADHCPNASAPPFITKVAGGTPPKKDYGKDYRIWRFDGERRLVNSYSSLCADISGGSKAAGTPLVQQSCQKTDQQRWETLHKSSGQYQIYSDWSNRCMAVDGWSKSSGTKVINWHCGPDEQHYKIYPVTLVLKAGSKTTGYVLRNASTGKCLAPDYGGLTTKGAAIRQYDCWW